MNKNLNDIKELFSNTSIEDVSNLILKYKDDTRTGVKNIIKKYEKKIEKYNKELSRLSLMCKYENKAYRDGKNLIVGLDEVGRGPLAGPVVTAGVILPKGLYILGVDDSKKLSSKKREELFCIIKAKAIEITTNMEDNRVIDEINILQATIKSMKKNIIDFKNHPDYLIIDSVIINNTGIPFLSIPKADEKSISVACASIIAKVIRDEFMNVVHQEYPKYGFDKNKGYGTKEHIEALKKYGPCPLHRKTFIKNFIN